MAGKGWFMRAEKKLIDIYTKRRKRKKQEIYESGSFEGKMTNKPLSFAFPLFF